MGESLSSSCEIFERKPYLLTFYDFPQTIWRSIYSTNLIESY
ncbi:transposase [Bacillus sp. JCM 19041]